MDAGAHFQVRARGRYVQIDRPWGNTKGGRDLYRSHSTRHEAQTGDLPRA
jgi:hypothetical protein